MSGGHYHKRLRGPTNRSQAIYGWNGPQLAPMTASDGAAVQPGIVGIKAFWRDGSRYLFEIIYLNQRFLKSVVNSLPMQGAIGRKFAGLVGSSTAEPFGINLMAAPFHSCGMMD